MDRTRDLTRDETRDGSSRAETERSETSDCGGRSEPETVVVRGVGEDTGRNATDRSLDIEPGTVLRDALLDAGISPYAPATRRLNCGGRGLCATCGVRIREGPAPDHWHDRLAERFGYPRLSCQVVVDGPMVVELVGKRVWGGRDRAE